MSLICAFRSSWQIHRDLQDLADKQETKDRAKQDPTCGFIHAVKHEIVDATPYPSLHNSGLAASIEEECREWVEKQVAGVTVEALNDDECYRRTVTRVCGLKRLALGKILAWLEDPSLMCRMLDVYTVGMSLQEAGRHASGRLMRELAEAKTAARQEGQVMARVQELATKLCQIQGLVVQSATEIVDVATGTTMLMEQAVYVIERVLCVGCAGT